MTRLLVSDTPAPEGELPHLLPAGGLQPTDVAFGGADRRDLYIAELQTGRCLYGAIPFPD